MPAIDAKVLREAREQLGDERVASIFRTFADQSPALLAEIRDGFMAGDLSRAARAAHSLKGSASFFGAADLARLCVDIESAAKNPAAVAGAVKMVATVPKKWTAAKAAIEKALGIEQSG